METDFRNAKVGDRVWDVKLGWGEVTERFNGMEEYVLFVTTLQHNSSKIFSVTQYNLEGVAISGLYRTLFWDEVKITPPPRPKRKVKKTVERWLMIARKFNEKWDDVGFCDDEIEAQENMRKAIAPNYYDFRIVKLTGEYEVEE